MRKIVQKKKLFFFFNLINSKSFGLKIKLKLKFSIYCNFFNYFFIQAI